MSTRLPSRRCTSRGGFCKRAARPRFRTCAECAEDKRRRNAALKNARRRRGLCAACGKEKAKSWYGPICSERRRKQARAYRAAHAR